MPLLLVLVLVVVPLLELAIVIQVGQWLGVVPTLAVLVVNSIIGAVLLRRESRRAWREFRAALEAGRWPGDEVTQGGLVIVGGAFLLTPGFLTDGVGFLCLIPATRAAGSRIIRSRLTASVAGNAGRSPRRDPGRSDGTTLDVEVVEIRREDEVPDGDAT